ncbi:MAG: NCS2 family permease [Lachnospira sp.]
MDKYFKLKQNKTTVKTEVLGGLTTFVTMAYILAINPAILSTTGMDSQAVLMATALASFVGTICMALFANYPFALAPGLGLNAFFAYTVCMPEEYGGMGYSWQFALIAVFIEGLIFLVITVTDVRESIFNAIPMSLKKGVSAGIGLFVAFIGLQHAGIVTYSASTLVTINNFKDNIRTTGMTALLALIGFIIIAALYVRKVKGSILIGIIATWILGIICKATGLYLGPDMLPVWSDFDITSMGKTFGQCFNFSSMSGVKLIDIIVIVFSFLFVDTFDTLGTLIGVADKAKILDKDGKMPRMKQALMADAVATSVGAVFGTSTTTTYVESSVGVAEGAKTGLASVVTALMFLLSIFLAPVFVSIPMFAIAPALIFVGTLMVSTMADIRFDNLSEAVPAFLCMIVMPLTYSISDGIAFGVISYVVINVLCGNAKKVNPIMYVLAVLFVLKYTFL